MSIHRVSRWLRGGGLSACWAWLLVGCASRSQPGTIEPQGLVEASDTAVAMTPAQRDRAYRAACEEGLRLADGDQYGLALAAFERALALEPSSTDALFNLGACYEAVGDPLRAVQIYRRVLEMNTEDADCYTNLGTSFIKLYYRDKSPAWRKMARDAWQHSLAIKPDQPQVREYLARSDSLD